MSLRSGSGSSAAEPMSTLSAASPGERGRRAVGPADPSVLGGEPWLRTNGVNTNGAAAKELILADWVKKVRPGTSGKIKVRLTKNMRFAVTPLVLTPFVPFREPSSLRRLASGGDPGSGRGGRPLSSRQLAGAALGAARAPGDASPTGVSWLQTNGVNTNGAAAKVLNFDSLVQKGTPWHFWEDKHR